MKRFFIVALTLLSLVLIARTGTPRAYAQGMMGGVRTTQETTPESVSQTAQDEADGKAVYDKLQAKQVTCAELTADDFDVLGDYFMGQRLGNTESHDSMNTTMKNMMGEEGEKQMHISLGKRLSGCDVNAPLPANGAGFMSMMGIGGTTAGYSMMGGYGRGMMGSWNGGWNVLGAGTWVLLIVFLILGIVYFWKGITRKK